MAERIKTSQNALNFPRGNKNKNDIFLETQAEAPLSQKKQLSAINGNSDGIRIFAHMIRPFVTPLFALSPNTKRAVAAATQKIVIKHERLLLRHAYNFKAITRKVYAGSKGLKTGSY